MLIALTMSIAMMATTIPAYAEPVQEAQTEVHHNEGYDPAHPLAGKIDEWDLRLSDDNQAVNTVSSWNVNAMLTGQMEQYFATPVGEYVDTRGNHIYTSQEDYDAARKSEQDLYNWYCNWLNSMDFENMSEMDRAKEIQKVLGQCSYEQGSVDYSEKYRDDYSILINNKGKCSEFAMTALSLAKALGLKSGIDGSIDHSWYYIQVDGKIYSGQNQVLSLEAPINKNVYVQ